jgi:GT2 family glycosyltransferase
MQQKYIEENMFAGVSIIIPTYNRLASLCQTLQSLAVQACCHPFEIIVVNDGGVPIMLPELSLRPHSHCLSIQLINLKENYGVSHARNVGAETAQFDILGFLDDDTIPDAGWVQSLIDTFTLNKQIGAVVGQINVTPVHHPLGRLRQSVYKKRQVDHTNTVNNKAIIDAFLSQTGEDAFAFSLVDYLSGGNCGIRRDVFMKVGGFDRKFRVTQDREIAIRILQHQYFVIYNEKLVIKHTNSFEVRQLVKGRFKSGMYSILLHCKHPEIQYEPYLQRVSFAKNFGVTIWHYYAAYGVQTTFLACLSIFLYKTGQLYGRIKFLSALRNIKYHTDFSIIDR